MAWRSSGTNNAEMVDKLKRFGVITSDEVEGGFRRVDRKFFVPRGNDSVAHSDQPLKEGNVHISAPHIYASAIQALDLVPDSTTSFLNIGSGTGYISCVVAAILGPKSLNYGVELQADVIQHCKSSIAKWKTTAVEEDGEVSTFHFMDNTADIKIVQGNGLSIHDSKGESVVGFDRIYIGAAVDKESLADITKLLSPGGILVGPVDDELVKVVRIGDSIVASEAAAGTDENEFLTDAGLNNGEFTSQILSGVRFAPLLIHPLTNTVIPASIWDPSVQRLYPDEFKCASMQLLMCSNSQVLQPLPRTPYIDERMNAAALLPTPLWLEVLSYTHRKWFEPEQTETDFLRRRLREEMAKAAKAEKARKESEERCLAAERETTVYRLLARRWQSRLNVILSHQQARHGDNDEQNDTADLSNLLGPQVVGNLGNRNVALNLAMNPEDRVTISGLRLLLNQMDDDAHVDEEEESDSEGDDIHEDHDIENMDEEGEGVDHDDLEFLDDENEESDSDSFLSVAEVLEEPASLDDLDDTDSVIMEDADDTHTMNFSVEKGQRSLDQPRTISVSSDDL